MNKADGVQILNIAEKVVNSAGILVKVSGFQSIEFVEIMNMADKVVNSTLNLQFWPIKLNIWTIHC